MVFVKGGEFTPYQAEEVLLPKVSMQSNSSVSTGITCKRVCVIPYSVPILDKL